MRLSEVARAVKGTFVMVLAGGQGERLFPLTKVRAKPAVPFAGVYRLIDFTLSNCLNSGLRRVLVLTQYKSESLDGHIRHGWNVFNPEIDEWIETRPPQLRMSSDWYVGTADAIFQNIYTLEQERPPHVLVLGGDHVYTMDYAHLIEDHVHSDADLTLACIPMPAGLAAGQLGVVTTDAEGRVTGLTEKPFDPDASEGGTCLCSMGVYAFKTPILARRLSEDARSPGTHDFARDVIPRMIEVGDRVMAHRYDGAYWRDIGTLDAYWEAHMDLVSVQPALNLYDADWPIRSGMRSRAPAKLVFGGGASVAPRSEVYNSLVCDGAIISGAYVCDSVIGPGVRVEVGSRIEKSVILDRTAIGRDVQIRRAIIDKKNSVPDGTRIGYDREHDRRSFTVTESGLVAIAKEVPFPH